MPTPLPPRSPFQLEMDRRLKEILATTSESERAFLEAQMGTFIADHAAGRWTPEAAPEPESPHE